MKNRFKYITFNFLLSIPFCLKGQNLKIESGTAYTKKEFQSNESYNSYHILLGVDYFRKDTYYLSSNLGYLRRDLKFDSVYKLHYLIDNIVFNYRFVKFGTEEIKPIIGVGFQSSIYFGNKNHYENGSSNILKLNRFLYGSILRIGLEGTYKNIIYGCRYDLCYNINLMGKYNNKKIEGESTLATFSLGYKFGLN